jgi:diguanylate cyclase (GGDEF)-like protein
MAMKWLDYFADGVKKSDVLQENRDILEENYRRGEVFAILAIFTEAVFAALDILAMLRKNGEPYKGFYLSCLILYLLMLAVSILFYVLARTRRPLSGPSGKEARPSEFILMSYITFIMCWSSLTTLLDQKLSGQTLVFMIITLACPAFFVISWRRMLIPFAASSAVILAGLPFFQEDRSLLASLYANLLVFIIISWLVSRMLYRAYVRDLKSSGELGRTQLHLEDEINRNSMLTDNLNRANLQMKNLSLVDEMTGVASRKGLRNFIDQAFEQKNHQNIHFGVLMIDIDRFAAYNEKFGQNAGDKALAGLASLLTDCAWLPLEIVARWGGEEFVFVSFDREEVEIHELAESIRHQVETLADRDGRVLLGPLTVSIGTGYKQAEKPSDVGSIIADANLAMYSAKRAGRNKVWSIPPQIKIVPVISQDLADEVAALAGKIWREHYTPIIGLEQVEYMLGQFQTPEAIWQDILERQYEYDLISYQGEWAGYMAACPDDEKNAFFLSKLYVDAMYRGNHLARRMLDNLIGRCQQNGYHKIRLTVNKHNDDAIAAYKKMGFAKGKPIVTDIGGGFVMDDFVMTLALAPKEENPADSCS